MITTGACLSFGPIFIRPRPSTLLQGGESSFVGALFVREPPWN
jgi:hypothetical protein